MFHFGKNNGYNGREFSEHVDIPLRNPIDVAMSWDARYKGAGNAKTPAYLVECLDSMLDCIANRNHELTGWKTIRCLK